MSGTIYTLHDTRASDSKTQEAVGAIEMQKAIEEVRDGAPIELAWLRYAELLSKFGKHSPACRAYLLQAVKLAAAV